MGETTVYDVDHALKKARGRMVKGKATRKDEALLFLAGELSLAEASNDFLRQVVVPSTEVTSPSVAYKLQLFEHQVEQARKVVENGIYIGEGVLLTAFLNDFRTAFKAELAASTDAPEVDRV